MASLATVALIAVIALSQDAAEPVRAVPAIAAGQAAGARILELPVPLHEATREALVAIREAQQALSRQNDVARLATARAHVQQARESIADFASDQGVSPEQRTAISNLNRELQRVLVDIDSR